MLERNPKNIWRALRLMRVINYNRRTQYGPLSLELALTSACNYKCYFCGEHSSYMKEICRTQSLSEDVISDIVRDIHSLKIPEVLLGGNGEPFLYRKLPKLIDDLSEHKVKIITNGSMLDRFSKEMFDRIYSVTISINSIRDSFHPIISGYSGQSQLKNIIKNVERLLTCRNAKNKIQINYVMSRDNYNELKDLLGLIEKWDVFFAIRPMFDISLNDIKDKLLFYEQIKEVYEKINAFLLIPRLSRNMIASLLYMKNTFNPESCDDPHNLLLPCYVGFYSAYIESDGTYKLSTQCEYNTGKNVIKDGLLKLWKSRDIQSALYSACLMHKTGKSLCASCYKCGEVKTYSSVFHKYFMKIPFQSRMIENKHKEYANEK